MTRESAEILLERGMRRIDDSDAYVFTRDLRHRAGSLYGYTTDAIKEFASHIKCPHLIVKADGGSLYEASEVAMEVNFPLKSYFSEYFNDLKNIVDLIIFQLLILSPKLP